MSKTVLLICPEEIITNDSSEILSVIDLNVVSEIGEEVHRLEASFVVNVVDDDLKRFPTNHFDFVYIGEFGAHVASVTDPTFLTLILNKTMKEDSYVFINSQSSHGLVKELKKNGFKKVKGDIHQDFKKEYGLSKKRGILFQKNFKTKIDKKEVYNLLGTKDKEYIKFLVENWKDMTDEEWKEIAEIRREEYGFNNRTTLDEEWIGLYNQSNLFTFKENNITYAFVNQDLYKILLDKRNPYTGIKLSNDVIKEMRDVVYFGSYSLSLKEAIKDIYY